MSAPAWPATYYAATAAPSPLRPALAGDVTADVCIVGGGFTGLSAALHLAGRGRRVVLLEAQRLGWGASGRNGGQIHSGHRIDQDELEKRLGADAARHLWRLSEEGKTLLRETVARHAIACDLRDGLLYAAWKNGHAPGLAAMATHLRDAYGYTAARAVSRDEMAAMLGTTRYWGGALDMGGGHLHPLNYALGLARAAEAAGAVLHEASPATAIERTDPPLVRTATGTVRAGHVILAGDSYLGALVPELAARMIPIRTYVGVTEPLLPDLARRLIRDGVAVSDTKFVVDYYRLTPDHRLLFGGGESYAPWEARNAAQIVRAPMLRVFPDLAHARFDYVWSGLVGLTRNRMPHAGRLTPHILFAQGYSGQGVVWAGLMGKLMADAVAGETEDFDRVARVPVPSFPGGRWSRWPLQVAAMSIAALLDRI